MRCSVVSIRNWQIIKLLQFCFSLAVLRTIHRGFPQVHHKNKKKTYFFFFIFYFFFINLVDLYFIIQSVCEHCSGLLQVHAAADKVCIPAQFVEMLYKYPCLCVRM